MSPHKPLYLLIQDQSGDRFSAAVLGRVP